MKIFNDINDIKNIEKTVIALGNFDGIHKGHQELIKRTTENAKIANLKSAVFTFANHPKNLHDQHKIKNIISFEEKIKVLEKLGVDYIFNLPFEENIKNLAPIDFIEQILVGKFKMKEGYCGFNYRFGINATGTPEILMKKGIEQGFGLHLMEPFLIDGVLVSSTLIRELIEDGRMEECTKYMGRHYAVNGEVVVGNRLGKTIGFPTSNLIIDKSMVTPPNGVYITTCTYNEKTYNSITNVGEKPTVGNFEKNIETHIFDFDKELYGKEIRVEFLKKTRDEKKFESIDVLCEQIKKDCLEAKAFHRGK